MWFLRDSPEIPLIFICFAASGIGFAVTSNPFWIKSGAVIEFALAFVWTSRHLYKL
jgi:hypothetical protein